MTSRVSRSKEAEDDVDVVGVFRKTDLAPPELQRVQKIDAELALIEEQLVDLRKRKSQLQKERAAIFAEQQEIQQVNTKRVDYIHERFPWSKELLRKAQEVFGIQSFRMCQEGVCNAVLDQRDVMVIMPTGAGKSLCYQLPAMLCDAMVLVISPLIALMTDQVFHLRERGISCALLSSSVPTDETQSILHQVRDGVDAPKLLYVTPERVAKSKSLLAALQKAYEAGRLGRIVVDEAHCCSTMGHDYRPDYNKLSICRKLFPNTPIMGLTATLGRQALRDVLHILGLRGVTEPTSGVPHRTVYFRAPLHRPNLRYQVKARPSGSVDMHSMLAAYILEHHRDKSGIVYCLSRKDTHTIAEALQHISHGQIRTGVYHSDLDEQEKHHVHTQWRTGGIAVVCATIAFGMGIDKGDVRFVLHACIPKSLDGYYQETGRAGRDGQQADCVLFYRPADLSRVSAMTASDVGGQEKLYAMLDYAQSPECRRVLFGRYFDEPAIEPCGTCDNCERGPPAAQQVDMTWPAWQIVHAAHEMDVNGGRTTLTALADVVRGLQQAQYKVADHRGRSSSAKMALDLDAMGGRVSLSREDCERVIVQLLLQSYLSESFQATAYTVNVYIRPGARAQQLLQYTRPQAETLQGVIHVVPFPSVTKRGAKRVKTQRSSSGYTEDIEPITIE